MFVTFVCLYVNCEINILKTATYSFQISNIGIFQLFLLNKLLQTNNGGRETT